MKKILFICSLFGCALLSAQSGKDTESANLQKQLTDLQEKIHTLQLKEMNEEISSQQYMLDHDWSEYTGKMSKAEQYELEVKKLEQQVADINQRLEKIKNEMNAQVPKNKTQ